MPARASTLLVTSTGPVSISAGSEPMLAKARMRARGLRPSRSPGLGIADQHRRGAIDDARRIAGMMHVVDRLDLRMRLDRHGIEAALVAHRRRRTASGRRATCMSVPGRMCSSLASSVRPLTSRTGTTALGEAALVPGRRGALLALDRIGVDIVAREAVFRGDEIGRDALRHEVGRDGDQRIDRPGAARGADADAAHRFDAAADRAIVLARHDLGGREIHRVEAGGAEAVDLHAGDVRAVVRPSAPRRARCRRRPRRPDRRSRARHRRRMVLSRPLRSFSAVKRRRGEPQGRDFVQRAVGLAAPARRAHVVVDEGVRHACLFGASDLQCHHAEPARRAESKHAGPYVLRLGRVPRRLRMTETGAWRSRSRVVVGMLVIDEVGRHGRRLALRQVGDVLRPRQQGFDPVAFDGHDGCRVDRTSRS